MRSFVVGRFSQPHKVLALAVLLADLPVWDPILGEGEKADVPADSELCC